MRTPSLCLLLPVSWAGPGLGADKSWTGIVSSNWFEAGSWDPPGVPDIDGTVTITHLIAGNSPGVSSGSATFNGAGRLSSSRPASFMP